jgi:hypothetical protein
MENSLLIGNGINMLLGISALSTENIAKRFEKSLHNSSCFYEMLFNVPFSKDVCKQLISYNENIETLAGKVYKYIIENMHCPFNEAVYQRLVDEITGTAINAIFFDKDGYIDVSHSPINLTALNRYEKIFSLNYMEFWDLDDRCCFLHKRYYLPEIAPYTKPIIFYNRYRYAGLKKYKNLVESMRSIYQMIEYGYDLLIFAPDCIDRNDKDYLDKNDVISLTGYPSETLIMDEEDIFPSDPPNLYEELDNISQIDVFGVSPYGDKSLIEKLVSIGQGTIFVHHCDPLQIAEWRKYLPNGFIYRDSEELFESK